MPLPLLEYNPIQVNGIDLVHFGAARNAGRSFHFRAGFALHQPVPEVNKWRHFRSRHFQIHLSFFFFFFFFLFLFWLLN